MTTMKKMQQLNSPVKILLVDDLPGNLLALEGLLRRPDIDIFKARSGIEALEFMMLHEFAVAFVDVQMPGMSGFELAEFMRGSKKTKNVPIVFVTATAKDQSFSFRGYESGAIDFLLKPLDTFAVKSKANVFVELYRQRRELKNQLTTITKLAEELSCSKNEAERANASKTQFLANMSHEIRSPIGAILGFNDLMKNSANSSEENRNYMAIVERNSQQLLRLIDDILDLSKVEAGMMTAESVSFSLVEMLADFVSAMVFRADAKGIQFRFELDTPIPDLICSDPVRLRQVLHNVVGNALKFTENGYVELRVSFAEPILSFEVKDTGIGISKEQESRLFQPFAQADLSTTRKFGGTGLGLVLSKLIAEVLGGKLELVKSQYGVGSHFLIEVQSELLPDAKCVGRDALTCLRIPTLCEGPLRQVLTGLKVLLVEDSPDNQNLITIYLRQEGAIVKCASDGACGVDLALAEDFDVLLMDIQMPVLDGHEATKKLRLLKYSKPIVALTAHAMKEERAKCFESGFSEFLTKPVQRNLLVELLSHYLPSSS